MKFKQILLIEDNRTDIALTMPVLEKNNLGNEVAIVRNGVEALEYLFQNGQYADRPVGPPRVILLNLNMRKIDRLEVIQMLNYNSKFKGIPIIAITSSLKEKKLYKRYNLNIDVLLPKNQSSEKIAEVIKNNLN